MFNFNFAQQSQNDPGFMSLYQNLRNRKAGFITLYSTPTEKQVMVLVYAQNRIFLGLMPTNSLQFMETLQQEFQNSVQSQQIQQNQQQPNQMGNTQQNSQQPQMQQRIQQSQQQQQQQQPQQQGNQINRNPGQMVSPSLARLIYRIY